jgi:hypothetical protein
MRCGSEVKDRRSLDADYTARWFIGGAHWRSLRFPVRALPVGSTAQLFTGTDGVRTYFSKLPAGIKFKMGDQQAIAHGPDLLFNSGFADFTLANGTVLPYRLTLALVKVDGKWLVAQHHGSPVPT